MKASGSGRPKRGRAARGGLRYEHRPGRPAGAVNTRNRGQGRLFGCVTFPVAFLALLAPVLYLDTVWGKDIWARLAPAWPGGAYAFAGCVGALVPLVFLAFVAPLTPMNWERSRLTSLARVLAALPGLAAGWLVAGVVAATWRPRHRRDWNGSCRARGGPCWVHDTYPLLWAVGTAATVVVTALLIWLFARHVRRTDGAVQHAGTADSPATPVT